MSTSQSWWDAPRTPPLEGKDTNLDFEQLDPAAMPEAAEELLTRRIHLLGTGSIGTLVAHSLRLLPNPPPVTILMHRGSLYDQFKAGSRMVRLVNKNTLVVDEQIGYDAEVSEQQDDSPRIWKHIPSFGKDRKTPINPLNEAETMGNGEVFIYTLIVTVKGPATVEALGSIKHRVDSRTTILLMQNGMGQIDQLNEQVFTDPKTRPTYMLGIISHGCYMQGPFAVVHAGFGSVALGIYRDTDRYPLPPKGYKTSTSELSEAERTAMFPSDQDLYSNLSSRYLLRTLTRSTELACAAYPYLDIFQLQLEKLVSNCVLNPLTALLDVENGAMLENSHLTRVHRLLIAEISLVIRGLPELQGIPNARQRFSPARLERFFEGICKKTARNSSSMREDFRRRKESEIEFLNGYIVKRGEDQGIKCVLNYMIMQLIEGKAYYDFTSEKMFTPHDMTDLKSTREGDTVVLEHVQGSTKPDRDESSHIHFSS